MAKILTEYFYLNELMTRWGCDLKLISTLRQYTKNSQVLLKLWVVTEERNGPDGSRSAIVNYLNSAMEDTPADTLKRVVADVDNVHRVENNNDTALRFHGTDYLVMRYGAVCGRWLPAGTVIRLFPEDKETRRLVAAGVVVAANEYNPSSQDSASQFTGHGVLSIIINMRNDGKQESEIAHFLKKGGLSIAQVGALLYLGPLNTPQNTIASHAKRLLNS